MSTDEQFSAVFREHYPAVLAFARRRVGDADAEDVTAEAFTVAWRRWSDAPREVRPWLFGIAKNVMNGSARSARRRGRLEERVRLEPSWNVPDHSDDVAVNLDLRAAWSDLSVDDQEVIALVAWDGLSGAEAAQVLHTNRVAYAARLSRARRRLRRHVVNREGLAGRADDPPGRAEETTWVDGFVGTPARQMGGESR